MDIYSLISLISTLLIAAIIIAAIKLDKNKPETNIIPYVVILIVIVAVYFFKIGEYPWGINQDEAGAMYDGINIAKFGCDRYLNKFPVYFTNYGDGQNALFTYVFAGWYKLLSLFKTIDLSTYPINTSLFILRFPTVMYNMIAYLICFLVIKKEYGIKKALISSIVFMSIPFAFMHSRFSLESYYLFPTLLVASCLFIKGIRNHDSIAYVFSGIAFGLSLYSYAIAFIIVPFTLICLLILIIYTKNFKWSNCIAFVVPIIILAIPILLFFIVNYFGLEEFSFMGLTITKLPLFRAGELSIRNLKENLLGLEFFRRILYDIFDYNSRKAFSTIYYLNIPFFFYGLYLSIKRVTTGIKKKEFIIDYLALILLIVCTIVGLLTLEPNVNKLNGIYLPICFYIALGYISLFTSNKILFRSSMVVLLVNYCLFIGAYFTYNQTAVLSASKSLCEQIQEMAYINNNKNRKYYINTEQEIMPIYFALYTNTDAADYDALVNNIEKFKEIKDMNGIYLVDSTFNNLDAFTDLGFNHIDNGNYCVFYKK